MELERKWNGKYCTKRNNVQWNGNGKEMEWKKIQKTKWKRNELEWNGKGMESKWKMEQRQKEKVCYRNEQKSKRTDLKQKKFIQNGMEMEWKENGNGMENINIRYRCKMEWKWNENGMEMEWNKITNPTWK